MRLPILLFAMGLCALVAVPARAQSEGSIAYDVAIVPRDVKNPDELVSTYIVTGQGGTKSRKVSLVFRVKRTTDGAIVNDIPKDEIVIEENGVPAANLDLTPPAGQKLTVILAIDVSGSMARANKMEQAKAAALKFLEKLDKRADVGLILFDHEAPARNTQGGGGAEVGGERFLVEPARDP